MEKYSVIVVVFWFFAGLAQARSTAQVDWSSSVDLKAISFPYPVSPLVNNQLYQGEFKLGAVRTSKNFQWTAKLDAVADPANNSPEERSFFDLPEFNGKAKWGPWQLKVGTDIYAWGITDVVNPVDLVNTRNYFDPIHSRKLGAGAATVSLASGWFAGEAVFIPQARPAQLPGGNSRWLPRQFYVPSTAAGQGIELQIPNQFTYSYLPRQTLGNALQNNVALRLQSHLQAFDFALYGYDGVAPVPIFSPIASGTLQAVYPIQIVQVNSNIQIQAQDYRQQTGGASLSKTVGSWQFKIESASTQPAAEALGSVGWSTSTVYAIEKTWELSSAANLVTVLQYSSGQRSQSTGNDFASIVDFFDANWMLGGHFTWRDNDAVTFFYSYDLLTSSDLADIAYEHRLGDSWKFTLGGTSIDGPATAPLSVYANNKNFFADLGWSY